MFPSAILVVALANNIMAVSALSLSPYHKSLAFHPSAPSRQKIHYFDRRVEKTRSQTLSFDANKNHYIHRPFKMTNDDDGADMMSSPCSKQQIPGVIFPGGGLFFYWQAGVIVSPLE